MKMPSPRGLSQLGPRGTFEVALLAAAEENNRIVGLTADLATTAGMERFRDKMAERFINVGIAEQNLVGVAAGLADDGWVPFAVTFANFAAIWSCEFVRHHLGYMQQNFKLVGMGAGFAMGQFGTTHYSLEDMAVLRAIPTLTVISRADCSEAYEAVHALSVSSSSVLEAQRSPLEASRAPRRDGISNWTGSGASSWLRRYPDRHRQHGRCCSCRG